LKGYLIVTVTRLPGAPIVVGVVTMSAVVIPIPGVLEGRG
jgi:hypothetical protein